MDKDKAMKLGIPEAQVLQNVNVALSGMPIGILHRPSTVDQIGIVLQMPEKDKSSIEDVLSMKVVNKQGMAIPIGDLVKVTEGPKDKSINRKDQKRVVYVTTDVAGKLESPIYAMSDVSKNLSKVKLSDGYKV